MGAFSDAEELLSYELKRGELVDETRQPQFFLGGSDVFFL